LEGWVLSNYTSSWLVLETQNIIGGGGQDWKTDNISILNVYVLNRKSVGLFGHVLICWVREVCKIGRKLCGILQTALLLGALDAVWINKRTKRTKRTWEFRRCRQNLDFERGINSSNRRVTTKSSFAITIPYIYK
jgi:hypothetical protein